MILKSGRVLENNPTTMEYVLYCISITANSDEAGGSVHGISVPSGVSGAVKSRYKQEL